MILTVSTQAIVPANWKTEFQGVVRNSDEIVVATTISFATRGAAFRAAQKLRDAMVASSFQDAPTLRDNGAALWKRPIGAAIRTAPQTTKRQAYDIVFRCTLNGCDWSARIFLRDASEGFDVMYRRLAYGSRGPGEGKLRYGKEFYCVVSCAVSADQSRPSESIR